MFYRKFSSVTDSNNGHTLYIDTSSGDCWLEQNGVLLKQDNVDDTKDQTIIDLNTEFEK